MNMLTNGGNFNGPVTMSSREIAELCEKQHKHVLRDIETMLEQIAEPKFGPSDFASTYKDSTGRTLKEYRLPKDLTVTLITGYRADLRYKVVKRLEQLEGQGGHALPRNFAEALQLAADQAKRIEAMAKDVAAHERLTKADGSMCFRDSAKSMQVRPIELTNYMARNRWIYRQSQNGPWLAYQDKITAGYLEHKVTTVDRSDGTEKAVTQCRITAKGLSKLAKLMGDRA
ncbi:phage regulatory protein/antirepressor Ant [Paracoccus sp. pheM1]|uniref:phage regulatory protein/antirepressor Ant n=1 Tax=Paracoccus sp. pheM1 TaxID=2831675 RepID=UPI001BDB9456|nr:phage regulatory protein/antirepressor Ant [Paracoccus sp. pheM1]MBT0780584.1 phage antirepressor KilAC domain-containing protein [Paracoccus sp. pheM1]